MASRSAWRDRFRSRRVSMMHSKRCTSQFKVKGTAMINHPGRHECDFRLAHRGIVIEVTVPGRLVDGKFARRGFDWVSAIAPKTVVYGIYIYIPKMSMSRFPSMDSVDFFDWLMAWKNMAILEWIEYGEIPKQTDKVVMLFYWSMFFQGACLCICQCP